MSRTNDNTAGNYFSASINWLPTNATILWRCKTSFDSALITILGQRSNANTGFGVHRDQTNDRIHFVTYGHTDLYSDTNSWPADGSMHVFAITKSGTSVSFYVDGVAKGTGTLSGATVTTGGTLALGALWYQDNGPFLNNISAELAEVALFSRVLSAGELRRYYLGEAPNNYNTSLDHYWKLDESSGNATATTGTTMTQTGTMGSATHPTMNYTGAVNVTAKSIGTSSRTYSTIQAWEDACPSDLTASNEIWKGECYNDSQFSLSAAISVSGTTTDATRYLWLSTGAGQSFRDHADKNTNALVYDSAKGVGINANTTGVFYLFSVGASDLRLSNLQLRAESGATGISSLFVGGQLVLGNCIVESRPGFLVFSDSSITAVNSVFYSSAFGTPLATAESFSVDFVACTFVFSNGINPAFSAWAESLQSSLWMRSCAVIGADAVFSDVAGTPAFGTNTDYNATDLNSASIGLTGWGTNSLTSIALNDQLVSLTTDFRVKAGSALINEGGRYESFTGDVDILGRTRSTSTPTIGAYEYIAGPTLTTAELISLGATTATPRVYVDMP